MNIVSRITRRGYGSRRSLPDVIGLAMLVLFALLSLVIVIYYVEVLT